MLVFGQTCNVIDALSYATIKVLYIHLAGIVCMNDSAGGYNPKCSGHDTDLNTYCTYIRTYLREVESWSLYILVLYTGGFNLWHGL